MASKSLLSFSIFSILVSQLLITHAADEFAESLNPSTLNLKKQKLTHFRVYWHDVVSGSNPSVVTVVRLTNNTSANPGFGSVSVFDDMLTIGKSLKSKLVGRAQGLYADASQQTESALLVAMNFVFFEGKYNGSGITIMGRNTPMSKVREMPIIGGSGLFRFARGYVKASTANIDMNTGDVTVKYHVYVLHY